MMKYIQSVDEIDKEIEMCRGKMIDEPFNESWQYEFDELIWKKEMIERENNKDIIEKAKEV